MFNSPPAVLWSLLLTVFLVYGLDVIFAQVMELKSEITEGRGWCQKTFSEIVHKRGEGYPINPESVNPKSMKVQN